MSYAEHFSTRATPQSEQADRRQVQNHAGGYTFQLDLWKRLDRWLILGAEGGSYYASEREMTRENAGTVLACLDVDGPRTVARIREISVAGRAPKNDPAIFALAIAAGHSDPETRRAALAALPSVCRIGTHLFQFVEAVQNFRGWGRGLRRGIGNWYAEKSVEELAYQLAKYQQRNGWSHADLLRLSHPAPQHAALYRWAIGGEAGPRAVRRGAAVDAPTVNYPDAGGIPAFTVAFERLRKATTAAEAVPLIRDNRFTHEMVPSELKNSSEVWAALLPHMPLTALIRNLAKLTSIGLLAPLSASARLVAEKLTNVEALRKARVHPLTVLMALKTYERGYGDKGSLRWTPVREVVDALDSAFYAAFQAIEPTGKRVLLALDISGSMSSPIMGTPLSAREASAAMAMVTARSEQNWHCVGFTSSGFKHGAGVSMHAGYPAALTELTISPKQRLDDVVRSISNLPFGGTDCALPMLYAAHRGLEVDVFHVYTDSETWAGAVHPHQALRMYREKTGIPAKLAVVGMTATEFTIADPADGGMLDVVGFDTAAPAVLADFARS